MWVIVCLFHGKFGDGSISGGVFGLHLDISLIKQSFHCLLTSYEGKFKLGYNSGKEKRKQGGIVNGNRFEQRLQLFSDQSTDYRKIDQEKTEMELSLLLILINPNNDLFHFIN